MFEPADVERALTVAQALAKELCSGTDTELMIEVHSETEKEAAFILRLKRVEPCM
jgi:hypothetical protein